VFYSGETNTTRLFNPFSQTWTTVANTYYVLDREYGSSVLLPLTPANNYDPRVFIMGGGNPGTATTELIDLGATTPAWKAGPNMSQPRIEMNATLLPNGKVLAMGGSLNDEDTTTASLNADLYDPAKNTFSSAGANAYPRLYHSVSLLLPDGTVWFAGGNPERGSYEDHMEIYQPAYLFNADGSLATRPTISSAPSSISYGTSSSIVYQNAVTIAYPGPQQAGGLNVVIVGWNDSSCTITSVADTNGNKYFLAAGTTDATGPDVSQAIYVASNIIGGPGYG
jgi:hypothetical protein